MSVLGRRRSHVVTFFGQDCSKTHNNTHPSPNMATESPAKDLPYPLMLGDNFCTNVATNAAKTVCAKNDDDCRQHIKNHCLEEYNRVPPSASTTLLPGLGLGLGPN